MRTRRTPRRRNWCRIIVRGDRAHARRDASAERDRHIAERINATLQPGEIGVLLLGPAREVQALLASDIIVKKVMSLPSQSW